MTHEEIEVTKKLLQEDFAHHEDKKTIYGLFNNYDKLDRSDQFGVFDEITLLAKTFNWSRRKLYALISEILFEVGKDEKFPDYLYEDISNYIDTIVGHCASEVVIRLNNDPKEQRDVASYARSDKWVYEAFYNEKT